MEGVKGGTLASFAILVAMVSWGAPAKSNTGQPKSRPTKEDSHTIKFLLGGEEYYGQKFWPRKRNIHEGPFVGLQIAIRGKSVMSTVSTFAEGRTIDDWWRAKCSASTAEN